VRIGKEGFIRMAIQRATFIAAHGTELGFNGTPTA
jgi:hypothetical protein